MKLITDKTPLILKLIYFITVCYAFCISQDSMDYLMLITSILLPFLIPTIFHIASFKYTNEIACINITFIYFASLIGSCLHAYSYPYYDKLIHFFSGVIILIVGLMLYRFLKSKTIDLFALLFSNLFNLSIALIWEFYEYFMLIAFDYDCIRHYKSGVHDAISDMFVAFIGGLLISFIIYKSKDHCKLPQIIKVK